MEFDDLSNRVIGCAIEVHRELGPGLLESTYEQCLAHELKLNGIGYRLQIPQPVDQLQRHKAQEWHHAFCSVTPSCSLW
ncbi:MAG TPA: GxxExxY protein [Candidatus Sumerlaeota bacterium]|nr:GxxExxY protein [Candidatus Sumerlaeota bacterium]